MQAFPDEVEPLIWVPNRVGEITMDGVLLFSMRIRQSERHYGH